MSPLLHADDVTVRYRGNSELSLQATSVVVHRGESLGVVGESGSGKSTLAKVLVGLLAPSSGAALINGRPWSNVGRKDDARRLVQMVFQDPYGALNPNITALDTVIEVLRHCRQVPRGFLVRRATDLLAETGLAPSLTRRYPRDLSGGECQRVGIARALACDPEVLIADEPTSALDVSVQAQILNLLMAERESRGCALVVISHDLGVIRYLSDSTLVMRDGAIVESGKTEEIFQSPRHPYTQELVRSATGLEQEPLRSGARPAGVELFREVE